MTDIEQRAFDILMLAEQQQVQIQEQLAFMQKNNEENQKQIIESAKLVADIASEQTARKMENRVAKSVSDMKRIQWTHYAYAGGGLLLTVFMLMVFLIVWTPSLDEINERRAQAEKYGFEFANCSGKPCVRVIKKACGYGAQRDFCVIDSK